MQKLDPNPVETVKYASISANVATQPDLIKIEHQLTAIKCILKGRME